MTEIDLYKKFRIPRSFQLLGHTIEVEFRSDLFVEMGRYGHAIFHEDKIAIQKPSDTVKFTIPFIRGIFYHELFHFVTIYSTQPELTENETYMTSIGELFAQFDKSKSFTK